MNLILFIFAALIPLDKQTSMWLNLGGGINLTTIFTILLLIAWLINDQRIKSRSTKNPVNIPVTLLLIMSYLSFFTGWAKLGIPFFGDEFRIFKSFLITLLLFFIVANNVNNNKTRGGLLKIMGVMVIFAAILTVKEFRQADIWHYDEGTRVQIWGMQPNMFGLFFAQYLPIFAAFAFLSRNVKNKLFNVGIFALCIPGLMFTYSRGAYLGILGALLVMGFLGGKKVFTNMLILGFVALIAQAVIVGHGRIIPVSVRERFDSISKPGDEKDLSIREREEVWTIAKAYIRESPIFGYGYDSSERLLPRDPHNMYLKFALESGIPTLAVFIWLIIAAFRMALRVYKVAKDNFHRSLALGFMGSVVALAIGNCFGSRLVLLAANGYFMILMGMVAQIYGEVNQKNVPKLKI